MNDLVFLSVLFILLILNSKYILVWFDSVYTIMLAFGIAVFVVVYFL
jgi:hypothetical protein